jgi:hypothetical protein
MDYKTRRYKQGLDGKKPGSLYFDKAAHRAQVAGYRAHLKNQDLADKLLRQSESESGSYESSPLQPLNWWQRILWFGIGCVLIYLDYLLSRSIATTARAFGNSYWFAFGFYFMVLPGGILGWPAYIMISMSLSKD